MKKMQNSEMEITRFAAEDVMTISGLTIDSSKDTVSVIWLDATSVANFNNYSSTDNNLKATGSYLYYAYSQDSFQDMSGEGIASYYASVDRRTAANGPSSEKVMTMEAGNSAQYKAILRWLNGQA